MDHQYVPDTLAPHCRWCGGSREEHPQPPATPIAAAVDRVREKVHSEYLTDAPDNWPLIKIEEMLEALVAELKEAGL